MNYAESVRFLYSLGNEVKAAKLGLDRMAVLLEALGEPHRACEFIHVAGTNGKGSVCAMLESALRIAGRRTGLYTSPHLESPTERIRICGEPVSEARFATAFDTVHEAAERLLASGALDAHPTYFETVTAMAFVLFRESAVETAVIEVGLGGTLDATNVIRPRLAVVTPIDFDHEKFLGSSIESIATEKAGILKPGVPAVFAAQRPEADAILQARARELGIQPVTTSQWSVRDLLLDAYGSRFSAVRPARPSQQSAPEIPIECPLAGEHQIENALTAVAALDALGFPSETIREGIRRTRWPGRLERARQSPEIILDGAHNPAGARALAAYIERFFERRRVWLVYGAMRDKAVAEMTGILFPLAERVIATAPDQARAVRPETIPELAAHPHMQV
ncbi:MAG: folylpolyglutamate synthase/dihydrofolate synthase family protein, partial [Bryobacteraceae bacterium]